MNDHTHNNTTSTMTTSTKLYNVSVRIGILPSFIDCLIAEDVPKEEAEQIVEAIKRDHPNLNPYITPGSLGKPKRRITAERNGDGVEVSVNARVVFGERIQHTDNATHRYLVLADKYHTLFHDHSTLNYKYKQLKAELELVKSDFQKIAGREWDPDADDLNEIIEAMVEHGGIHQSTAKIVAAALSSEQKS